MRRLKEGVIWEICQYCSQTEIPTIYALWCGIACVGAALGRRVLVDQGHYVVYPNTYIVLVAGSGRCRKSTAIAVAEKFIRSINPPINTFCQKASPEGLIKAMQGFDVQGESVVEATAEGIIIIDELSTLIDRNAFATGMATLLTTMFDAKDSFKYFTRGRGEEIVQNSCVSILGGSTIEWIRDVIPTNSIGGGFTARFIFVYQEQHEKLILWTKTTEENKARENDIKHDLNQIAHMCGEFAFEQEAKDFLEETYKTFNESSELIKSKYLDGYANRRHALLFKLSMIISASLSSNRLITLKHAQTANRILARAELDMPLILRAIAAEGTGTLTDEVLATIQRRKTIPRRELISLMHHKIQAYELDRVLDTLIQSGQVSVLHENHILKYTCIKEERRPEKSFTEQLLDRKKGVDD